MPIKITCKCGQGFAAKERLAGRTLQCPKCGTRLKIPQPKPTAQPGAAAPSAEPKSRQATAQPKRRQQPTQPKARRPSAPKPKQPASKPQPTASVGDELAALSDPLSDPMEDLLGEAGLDGPAAPASAPGRTCPSCGTAMAPGAILCVACGFSQKSGKKLQTQHEPDEAAKGGPLSAGRPRRRGGATGGMGVVAVGLSMMYWSCIAIVGACVIMIGCSIAAGAARSGVPFLGVMAAAGGAMLAMLTLVVGQGLCLAVPRETGAKGLIIAAIVLEVGAVLSPFVILPIILNEMQGSLQSPGDAGPSFADAIPGLVMAALVIGGQITFLLFLKQLGEYLRHRDLVDKAQSVLQVYLMQLAIPFVWVPISLVLRQLPAILAGLIALAVALGMLGLVIYALVQYLALLQGLSKAIRGK